MAIGFRSALDWVFRDRRTGRIVIGQVPNVPLIVWSIASVLRWFVHGGLHATLGVIADIALGVWAVDEIARGVNPWRRVLGVVVLAGLIVRLGMSA